MSERSTSIDTLRARWSALAPREQRLAGWAAALVALALLWWLAVAPALRTLASSRSEHAQLDAQLQQMALLAAQAKALQAQPHLDRDVALHTLEDSVRDQWPAQAQVAAAGAGEGVTVTLHAASAEQLAQWLAQARGNAHALPREVHLTRAAPAGNAAGSSGEPPPARWDGTLLMSLPIDR